jgi:tRNA threonylcarbamoyladenosine biosynthesis protein TsaE
MTPSGSTGGRRWHTTDPEQTRALGRALAAELAPAGVLLLHGALAAGKTVLAQGVAAGLGIDPREVQSPTFTLVREHAGAGGRLLHLDLYRLDPSAASGLGLEDLFAAPAVKVVEWAERLPFAVRGAMTLELGPSEDGGRDIREVVVSPREPLARPQLASAGVPASREGEASPERKGDPREAGRSSARETR